MAKCYNPCQSLGQALLNIVSAFIVVFRYEVSYEGMLQLTNTSAAAYVYFNLWSHISIQLDWYVYVMAIVIPIT